MPSSPPWFPAHHFCFFFSLLLQWRTFVTNPHRLLAVKDLQAIPQTDQKKRGEPLGLETSCTNKALDEFAGQPTEGESQGFFCRCTGVVFLWARHGQGSGVGIAPWRSWELQGRPQPSSPAFSAYRCSKAVRKRWHYIILFLPEARFLPGKFLPRILN